MLLSQQISQDLLEDRLMNLAKFEKSFQEKQNSFEKYYSWNFWIFFLQEFCSEFQYFIYHKDIYFIFLQGTSKCFSPTLETHWIVSDLFQNKTKRDLIENKYLWDYFKRKTFQSLKILQISNFRALHPKDNFFSDGALEDLIQQESYWMTIKFSRIIKI